MATAIVPDGSAFVYLLYSAARADEITESTVEYGVAFKWDPTSQSPIRPRLIEMDVVFWSQVPLTLILIGVFRKHWLWIIVIGLSLFSAWLALGASMVSSMSITGRWL